MSNLSRKSIKLKIQDTVRKIKVEPNNIINNIKKIIGKFKNITYTDEEGDVISCLTEEELTSAVFEDGISSLVVKQKSELTTPNIDDQPTSSSLVEIEDSTDRAENLEGLELRESSTAQGTTTGELTGNIPQNGSDTLEIQSHELKDFKKIVESWKREHNDKYGIDCEFTIETISGKTTGELSNLQDVNEVFSIKPFKCQNSLCVINGTQIKCLCYFRPRHGKYGSCGAS